MDVTAGLSDPWNQPGHRRHAQPRPSSHAAALLRGASACSGEIGSLRRSTKRMAVSRRFPPRTQFLWDQTVHHSRSTKRQTRVHAFTVSPPAAPA